MNAKSKALVVVRGSFDLDPAAPDVALHVTHAVDVRGVGCQIDELRKLGVELPSTNAGGRVRLTVIRGRGPVETAAPYRGRRCGKVAPSPG